MSKKLLDKPSRPVYPSPAALVTSINAEGRPTVLTLAEVFNISISRPVVVGIAIRDATASYGAIVTSREFVVNFPTVKILTLVDRAGTLSGRDVPDKIAHLGLTPLQAKFVRPPLLAECPLNIECRVLSDQVIGDHHLILGEAVAEHVDEDILDAAGKIVTDRLDFLSYVHGEYWGPGKRLGHHGYSGR